MKRALLASGLISGALFGCATDGPPPKPDAPTIERPAPDYADLAARYNANASALDRVWSRVTVVLDATDAEGSTRRDQGEGHLQWIRPDRLALSIGKVGQEGFYLGSGADRYFWLDLVSDPPTAVVGAHATATQRSAEAFGLPVHPLDLAELLGLTTLPERALEEGAFGPMTPVSWSQDGSLAAIRKPVRAGSARLLLEPETARLRRVELYDTAGRLIATSVLSRDGQVETIEGGGDWPWLPTRIEITLGGAASESEPGPRAEAVVSLYAMENRGSRQREVAFDFDRLLRAYKVSEVVDLDERDSVAPASDGQADNEASGG